MNYDAVTVSRLEDRTSPSHPQLFDRWRTLRLLRRRNVFYGRNVIVKANVKLYIGDTGRLEIGDHVLIHPRVHLLLTMPHPSVRIGNWVILGMETVIAAKNSVEIGDYTVIAPRCYLVDHEHGFSSREIILNQKSVLKSVRIGRDCYLGAGCMVLAGITIGDGAIVGAGSVVTRDIPPNEIWGGNPARKIRDRE